MGLCGPAAGHGVWALARFSAAAWATFTAVTAREQT
jgi:hypothetical protein